MRVTRAAGHLGGMFRTVPRFLSRWSKLSIFRNGGHVNPVIYDDYEELKRVHGMEAAKQIIKFRLRHFPELRQVVEEEDMLEETRCRSVEHSEVYYDRDLLEAARRKFKVFEADMPEEAAKFEFYEAEQAIEVCWHNCESLFVVI